MKHLFRFLAVVIMTMTTANSYAYDFEVDGIYYNITKEAKADDSGIFPGSCEVTYGDVKYRGEITIPEKVEHTGLTYIVNKIGNEGFSNCTELTSVTFCRYSMEIGDYAFSGCTSLVAIDIQASKPIGSYAFANCKSLTTVIVREGNIELGENVFFNVPLDHATLFATRDFAYFDSTDQWKDFYRIVSNSFNSNGLRYQVKASSKKSCQVTGFSDESNHETEIVIPSNVTYLSETYDVTSMYILAFSEENTSLRTICIPSTLIKIGDYIEPSASIANFYLPLFRGCSSLQSINVDSNNPNYTSEDGIWYTKDKSTIIRFPIANTQTNYTMPEAIKKISFRAFQNCKNLYSVRLSNSFTTIGTGAFYGCSSLSSIAIPNSVTSIEQGAFCYCTSLSSIIIPNSVTSIEQSVFSGCTALSSINIPNSVTSIEQSAFSGCTALSSIIIPNSVTSIQGYAFKGCSGLRNVVLPNSITAIPDNMFQGCTSLSSVNIPQSVKKIGNSAFSDCENLMSMISENKDPWDIEIVISGKQSFNPQYIPKCTLYVPQGSGFLYQTTYPWNLFGRIIEDPLVKVDAPVGTEQRSGKTYRIDGVEDRSKKSTGLHIKNGKKVLLQ